jgi:nucleoside-diphosphate-sugar epimerase
MTTQELHVVFGTGPLGQATARALLGRGHRVRMVNRSGRALPLAEVEVVAGDAYDPASVTALSAGAAAVYQCAQPAYHEWVSKFPPLQRSVIAGVAPTGAKLVVAENLYMYGRVSGPIGEGLPYSAHTRKGEVRARMAEEVQAAYRSGTLRTVSGRASDFYGPGVLESALGERVFAAALAGKPAAAVSRLDVLHSYTYIDDFGEALARLGEHDAALGQAWHVPNAAPLTQRELLTMLFEELELPLRVSVIGRVMLSLAGLFMPGAREMVEMLYEFEQPFVVDSSKYTQAFGDHATPIRAGLRQTIGWYRERAAEQQAPPAPSGLSAR